ncbi:SHC SH2 domain-binding protein 1 homolog B-like [Bufo gargarizans]|uniref:SHC SH2 domain-binding protein 1 homolog B-like n=1 Tax=Bufo gargarizans TaxID=30331 RepID=UPI001CF209AF|nr:SHC SH2 domain-binding protein 1 homolog B-like [Bufo gargarizans]
MLGRLPQNLLDEEETDSSQDRGYMKDVKQVLFQEDEDSDYGSHKKLGKVSPQRVRAGNVLLPDVFQTGNLLFYERFEAYKDYVLGDCKPLEVGEFIAEYLEQALLPCGWKAVWHTDIFQVLVEVTEVSCSSRKAVVQPCEPFLCECFVECVNEQSIRDLLEVKEQTVPLQELHLVFDDSPEYAQTAMAIEHVRFFYQNIWRSWDDEEEDYFDYFTRFAEPRLRLYYDILEDRIPSLLVLEYQSLLTRCEQVYSQFSNLRNTLSNRDSDSDCELDNVSMVEGMKMDSDLENLKRKLKLIENPLLRYLFCYQKSSESCSLKKKGPRPTGECIIHVVSTSMSIETLTSLTRDRLMPQSCNQSQEIQFHKDILEAVNACYDGDLVLVCPGQYVVYGQICIADSIHIEGYGMPDDIIIEKNGKGDKFVECAGAFVKISNMKIIQHNAVEGIVSILGGKTELENCVLQCDTTGITVKKSAELVMKYCDLYGAKGAGVEIYPGSNCSLIDNGIHHCRDGILIKDFIDEVHDLPKITLENNVIHNNEGYAVLLVKPGAVTDGLRPETGQEATNMDANLVEDNGSSDVIQQESEEVVHPEDEDNQPPVSSELVPEGDADLLPADVDHSASDYCIASEDVDGNQAIVSELTANCRRKTMIHKKRLSTLGITKAEDEQIMSQEMFVSIANNQFKRNGKGSFGTFLF